MAYETSIPIPKRNFREQKPGHPNCLVYNIRGHQIVTPENVKPGILISIPEGMSYAEGLGYFPKKLFHETP
jgi:hypothetical protein